jgi:hypothetical protein
LVSCCASHPDWAALTEHLVKAFRDIEAEIVIRSLVGARDAAELFSMTTADGLDAAERMVRHELMIMTGEIQDSARLAPESHRPRE